jgi:hypothetical protein
MAFSGGQSGSFCVPAGQAFCDGVVAQAASSSKMADKPAILNSSVTGFIGLSVTGFIA